MLKWKNIGVIKGVDYKGAYQISFIGEVKSFKNGSSKILKPSKNKHGYKSVRLCENGKTKNIRINRLVAQAFLGLDIDDTKMLVCHKDDNRINNHKDNLFLGTYLDNNKDMAKKGRAGMKGRLGKLHFSSRRVSQYSKAGKIVKRWDSMSDVVRELKIDIAHLSKVCNGKAKTAKGFKWKYI